MIFEHIDCYCFLNILIIIASIALSIFVIYLMKLNLQKTEELFNDDGPIINVHIQEDNTMQMLYKLDLTDGGTILLENSNSLKVKNILALFPFNEVSVIILDTSMKLFIVTYTTDQEPTVVEIPIIGDGTEVPVKVVPVKVVSESTNSAYILTNKGNIYEYSANITINRYLEDKKAIDIAVNRDGDLFFINNGGKLYKNNNDTVLFETETFKQIVSNTDTSILYGITATNQFVRIYHTEIVNLRDLSTYNIVKISCNLHNVALLTSTAENTRRLIVVNTDHLDDNPSSLQPISNHVLCVGDLVLYVDDADVLQHYGTEEVSYTISNSSIYNPQDPLKNVDIFTGTSIENMFVLTRDSPITCTNRFESCDFICDSSYDSSDGCKDIFHAIERLLYH
ncbi:hypothetical protein QKU58_gp066 [Pyramimonas orientalis virus]|uniref:Uncharacterized protein n=1 Tax=Pyramimonas orientalis virus 01B TaxID=3134525 RepID=A0A7M3UNK2_9VIRU|nr:hypothetical protein QKU58_gp066 [Pyramimonas orientalis virus]QOI90265.1 hypothetical protein HWQ62_00128 [Pyramimonas orientalis virus]